METVACNLCGSENSTPVYQMPSLPGCPDAVFSVVECNECGLGYLNPRPTLEEIQKYYPPSYYAQFTDKEVEHSRRYATEAGYLREVERRAKPWRLLDVGCANGDFPRFMRNRGWEIEGEEISSNSRPIRDFKVYTEPFPEIPVNEPSYDAVTAWAVLEHLHDPMAYFRKASVVLKRGGLFVFLVHNFNSLASRYLFREDIPRHLYFYTEDTVRRFLTGNAFRVERVHYTDRIFPMPPWGWLHFYIRTRVKRQAYTYQDTPLTRLQYLAQKRLPAGLLSDLRFAARNPVTASEWLLRPAFVWLQRVLKSSANVVYVARKVS
jgi:SAM-dependent methyltransferase